MQTLIIQMSFEDLQKICRHCQWGAKNGMGSEFERTCRSEDNEPPYGPHGFRISSWGECKPELCPWLRQEVA